MKEIILLLFLILFYKAEAQSVSNVAISEKADSLYEMGEYNKAIPLFKEVNRFQQVAKSYEAVGNYKRAKEYYINAISENQKNSKLALEYSKLLIRMSDYKQADSILQNLQSKYPKNPNLFYERGLINEIQNDSSAIQLFLKVYELDKNNINASYKIARNYIENRKFEDAEPFLDKALNLNPNSSRFLTLLALKQFYTHEYHDAIATYSLLVAQGDSYISLHENLATSYTQTLQEEKAMQQYNILFRKFDDQNPKWHHNVALLFRSMKEYDKAKKHLNIAIGLLETPLSKEYLELSYIYAGNAEYKNEMSALRKALVNNPNNEIAQYNLAVASDNYFKDKKTVVGYYENYLIKFGETGRMRLLAKQRLSDLKKELHFSSE